MKVFSSTVALLSISTAAASSVADVFSQHNQDPATADIPCYSELETFFECIGEACINCIAEVIRDIEEDPTCESLKNSHYCCDMNACATGDCAGKEESCKVAREAVVSCAEENYPASEEKCPGLCEEEKILDVADEESNNVVNVFSHKKVAPHKKLAPIVASVLIDHTRLTKSGEKNSPYHHV